MAITVQTPKLNSMAKKQKNDIITRADGSVVKIGGYNPPKAKVSAPKFKAKIKASNLPPKVDLRPYMTAVESQGGIGSCTANATAGAYEYLINRNQGINTYDVSRLFLYYNSRVLEGTEDADEGAYLHDVMQALAENGICSESSWPYVENRFTKKPSKSCYAEAEKNRIEKYESVDTTLDSWKSVLAQGYPIIFSVRIFDSFMNPRRGHISMPRRGEDEKGGHAMLCVGYSDPDQVFIVRNSWGTAYGASGYCYIPYQYMMNESLNYGDNWVIYDVNPIDPKDAEQTWSEDEESIFVDMNTEFDEMDDETWNAMCEELGDYDITYRLGALYGMATVGDDNVSDEEYQAAIDKLANILEMFGLDYDAAEVMEYCAELTNVEGFIQDTVDILGRYLSPGALATIAKDMYEIASVDGLDPEEEQFIDELVGDWFNEELAEEYDNQHEERRNNGGNGGGKKKHGGKGGKGGKKGCKGGKKRYDENGELIIIDDDDDDWDDDDWDDDDDLDLDDGDLDDDDDLDLDDDDLDDEDLDDEDLDEEDDEEGDLDDEDDEEGEFDEEDDEEGEFDEEDDEEGEFDEEDEDEDYEGDDEEGDYEEGDYEGGDDEDDY